MTPREAVKLADRLERWAAQYEQHARQNDEVIEEALQDPDRHHVEHVDWCRGNGAWLRNAANGMATAAAELKKVASGTCHAGPDG